MWDHVSTIATVLVVLVLFELFELPDWIHSFFRNRPSGNEILRRLEDVETRLRKLEGFS